MSWAHSAGDRVVCIDDGWDDPFGITSRLPSVGEIFHVAGSRDIEGVTFVSLVEIPIATVGGVGTSNVHFSADKFRPLVDEGLEILRSLLAPSPAREREEA